MAVFARPDRNAFPRHGPGAIPGGGFPVRSPRRAELLAAPPRAAALTSVQPQAVGPPRAERIRAGAARPANDLGPERPAGCRGVCAPTPGRRPALLAVPETG